MTISHYAVLPAKHFLLVGRGAWRRKGWLWIAKLLIDEVMVDKAGHESTWAEIKAKQETYVHVRSYIYIYI